MANEVNRFGDYNLITNITKSDTVTFKPPLDAVYAGGAGNVAFTLENGNSVVITLAAQAVYHPGKRISQVKSTGTTATLLVGIGRDTVRA